MATILGPQRFEVIVDREKFERELVSFAGGVSLVKAAVSTEPCNCVCTSQLLTCEYINRSYVPSSCILRVSKHSPHRELLETICTLNTHSPRLGSHVYVARGRAYVIVLLVT